MRGGEKRYIGDAGFWQTRGCVNPRLPLRQSPLPAIPRAFRVPRMKSGRTDSLRLFRVLGIDVYVHWAWIFVAIYEINYRGNAYSSVAWKIAEYLALFLIVLIHEFGHALACRQVGGTADQILLWPLGGVAYVSPPQRPGAMLWSIAAGPLVNVVLFFVFTFILIANHLPLTTKGLPDTEAFMVNLWKINFGLLIFNLMPVYPLDGGQILRSLLWFFVGPVRSMYVAVGFGFVGVAGFVMLAFLEHDIWIGIIAYFVLMNCLRGVAQARALAAVERLPRRTDFFCPSCGQSPPIGALWRCHQCGTAFDTFETRAVCPSCHTSFATTKCVHCHTSHPMADWRIPPVPVIQK